MGGSAALQDCGPPRQERSSRPNTPAGSVYSRLSGSSSVPLLGGAVPVQPKQRSHAMLRYGQAPLASAQSACAGHSTFNTRRFHETNTAVPIL
mmetsp:Transcript_3722/g.12291  ORF Transcript_3722/g.12291 Transcript_3722/m.12291 type:complete len:93 (+) Transcript_3722:292-570(+)